MQNTQGQLVAAKWNLSLNLTDVRCGPSGYFLVKVGQGDGPNGVWAKQSVQGIEDVVVSCERTWFFHDFWDLKKQEELNEWLNENEE